jgi:hypothetical protein
VRALPIRLGPDVLKPARAGAAVQVQADLDAERLELLPRRSRWTWRLAPKLRAQGRLVPKELEPTRGQPEPERVEAAKRPANQTGRRPPIYQKNLVKVRPLAREPQPEPAGLQLVAPQQAGHTRVERLEASMALVQADLAALQRRP